MSLIEPIAANRPVCSTNGLLRHRPNRSTSSPCRRPRSLTVSESRPSFSSTVRTMHAPARITSARFGWRPTICRRSSASRRAVELDLAVDLGAVEHRALDDVRVVGLEPVLDGGEVRDRAAHPDERVGRRPAVETVEAAAIARARGCERLVGDGPVEPEALGEPRRSDVHAELLVDPLAVAEGELRAAAARIEDGERAAPRGRARPRREVGEPRLLLAGDHLDLDAAARPDGVDELGAVRRDPQPGRPDRRDRLDARRARASSTIAGDRLDACARSAPAAARPSSSSPSPRRVTSARSTTVCHDAVRAPLADVELDRVRADVDHGEPCAPNPASALSPRGTLTCSRASRGRDRATAAMDERGIGRLDRDRAGRLPRCARR